MFNLFIDNQQSKIGNVPTPPHSNSPIRWSGLLAAKPDIKPYPAWALGAGDTATPSAYPRKILWRWLRRPFDIQWLDGLHLRLYPGNEACRCLFTTGRYEPNEFHLLSRLLRSGLTFIDAGANLGLFTVFAANRVGPVGTVLSIEPSRRELAIIETNIALNRLENIKLLPVALSDQPGEVDLLVAPLAKSGHNTLGAFGFEDTAPDHRERVSAQRLDDLVESLHLARVDVMKLDIEGAELAALRGARGILERYHPTLLVELSDRSLQHQQSTSCEVVALLELHGYQVYGFDRSTGLPASSPGNVSGAENVIAVWGDAPAW
jgi:FkbM family methyltransferase